MRRVGADTWVSGDGSGVPEEALRFSRATAPGDFVQFSQVLFTDFEAAGFLRYARGTSAIEPAAIVPLPEGALYLFRGRARSQLPTDTEGHPLTFIVEVKGSTARILPDRLYGWEVTDGALVGDQLLLTAQGGAVLKGVRP